MSWRTGHHSSLSDAIPFSRFTGSFSWIRNVPGEWLRIFVAHAACVPSTAFPRPRPLYLPCARPLPLPMPGANAPSCTKDWSSTSSMSYLTGNPANISCTTCTSKNAHLITSFVTVVVKEYPIARSCFAVDLCAANFKPTIT